MHIKAIVIFLAIGFLMWQPAISQDYFQQKVDYDIKAELDTLNKKLYVSASMIYTNNSSDNLDKIILHLWLNAMKDKTSNFSNQQLKMGRYDFYFSNEDQQGGYQSLDVTINDASVEFLPYSIDGKTFSDIAQINLKKPLKSGESIKLQMSYVLKIPYAFDRPGYKENLYQMTQWYPKPAVYDSEGWHAIPYLSLGEFYSEFGNYNVELTMPISYSVVGTGSKLESASSLNIEERKRTVSFTAKNVHDFAWFASEYYIPYTDVISIDGQEVKVNLFVKEDNVFWEKYMGFAKRALRYYSEEVGAYPYPEMTIVESGLGGSGMEYPMITILDMSGKEQQVDHLIAHEIGHNWFYGILASNERKHAWIDEGLTSYFDHKYDAIYYDRTNYNNGSKVLFRNNDSGFSLLKKSIIHLQRTRLNMKIDQDSEEFDPMNYIAMNYEKTAWIFEYIAAYLGKETFERSIQNLYLKWQFKHLSPDDLINVFEEISGKPVRQIFDALISSNSPIDFAVKNIEEASGQLTVVVHNKYNTKLPMQLSGYDQNNKLIASKWFDMTGEEMQSLKFKDAGFAKIVINGEAQLFEDNHRNNDKELQKMQISDPNVKVNFMKVGGDSRAFNVNVLPMVQHNSYDGLMLGMVAFSDVFPKENISYYFNPNYAFSSQDLAGSFAVQKDIYFKGKALKSFAIGLEGRQYHFAENELLDYNLKYKKVTPYLKLNFSHDLYNYGQLEYKWHHINREDATFTPSIEVLIDNSNFNVHQLAYSKYSKKMLSSYDLKIQLQYEKYNQLFENQGEYLKTSFEYNTRLNYNKNSKFFFRFYGSYFPINTQRNSSNFADIFTRGSVALSANGITDYAYDNYYFSRTGEGNSASSQIIIDDLGFKNTFETYSKEGMSNNYAMAVNLKADLPFSILSVIKVRPYIDAALSNTKSVTADPLKNVFYYSAGLAIELGDVAGIYLPLINDDRLKIQYAGSSLFSRVSFKLNLKKLNPWMYSSQPGRLIP